MVLTLLSIQTEIMLWVSNNRTMADRNLDLSYRSSSGTYCIVVYKSNFPSMLLNRDVWSQQLWSLMRKMKHRLTLGWKASIIIYSDWLRSRLVPCVLYGDLQQLWLPKLCLSTLSHWWWMKAFLRSAPYLMWCSPALCPTLSPVPFPLSPVHTEPCRFPPTLPLLKG